MIISHEHEFIFLKTRKTAGTSLEIALSQHCGPEDVITPIWPQDEAVRRRLGYRGPQNYAVPWGAYGAGDWLQLCRHRECLAFYNHAPAAFIQRYVGERVWQDYFVFCFERNPFDKAISLYYWVTEGPERPLLAQCLQSLPQRVLSNWPIYARGDEVVADFVGRYEHLDDDLAEVWARLRLPSAPELPRAKAGQRTDRRSYREVLDPAARAVVEHACIRELETFAYAF
jgi:hypothetical protein